VNRINEPRSVPNFSARTLGTLAKHPFDELAGFSIYFAHSAN